MGKIPDATIIWEHDDKGDGWTMKLDELRIQLPGTMATTESELIKLAAIELNSHGPGGAIRVLVYYPDTEFLSAVAGVSQARVVYWDFYNRASERREPAP
jgi:hypothetical protein